MKVLSEWSARTAVSAAVFAALFGCAETLPPATDTTTQSEPLVLGRRLIAGEKVACALTKEGLVYCWGLNSIWWEYGAPPDLVPGTGVPVMAITPKLVSLAMGVGSHFCGIAPDESAVCWGRGGFGQLGSDGIGDMGNLAGVVDGEIRWAELSVSRLTSCGISTLGVGFCWGSNQSGEVGTPSVELSEGSGAPREIHGGYTFKSVAAGWLHACGLTTAGTVYCWGGNSHGQLGIGITDTVRRRVPQPVNTTLTFKQITVGSRYTCALTTDGDAYCWGTNGTGQLGDGTATARDVPTLVAGGLKFSEIAASSGFATGAFAVAPLELQGGVGHTCALTTDGTPYCWGWNGNGELGDGTTDDKATPTPVAGDLTLNTIAVGGAYSCGMQGDNVWCWGSNANGQLGKGDIAVHSFTPQPVLAPFKQ